MKIIKIIISLALAFVFILVLFFVTSDYYLIAGSDAIDFSFHYPHWLHVFIAIAIVSLIIVYFLIKQSRYVLLLIGFFLLLALLSSQALVVSGKSNTIISYLYGFKTGKIAYDPGVGYEYMAKQSKFGYLVINDKRHTIFIITGFYPVRINLDDFW